MGLNLTTQSFHSASVYSYLRNVFLSAASIILIICSGCNKKEDLGVEALPADSHSVLISDSLELTTYTLREDSGRTDEVPTVLLGTFNDPKMGKVNASLNTQFLPSVNANYHGTSPIADSAVLSLNYKGFYGDASSLPQKFYVYVLNQNILRTNSYYSGSSVSHSPTLIGSASFTPSTNAPDSSVFNITLDKSFANYLLSIDSVKLKSAVDFANEFKGLCISTDTAITDTAAIFKFDIASKYSKIRLFYHASTQNYAYDFVANSDAAWFNHFNHNFSPYVIQQLNDTSNGKNQVLLQGMYGLKTFIKIKNIDKLKSLMPIVINKAELSVKIENTSSAYAFPQNLLIRRIDLNSVSTVEYNSIQKEYTANLPLYVQRLLEDKLSDKGFEIFINPFEGTASAVSAVLGGGKNTSGKKMKIKIIYTKI